MSKYLIQVNETYRVDTEEEVSAFIEKLKKMMNIISLYKPKELKEKGMIDNGVKFN